MREQKVRALQCVSIVVPVEVNGFKSGMSDFSVGFCCFEFFYQKK